jgi:hypothetical protein
MYSMTMYGQPVPLSVPVSMTADVLRVGGGRWKRLTSAASFVRSPVEMTLTARRPVPV